MGALFSREHELDAERFDLPPWQRDDLCELRWVADVSSWRPRAAEWELLLAQLPPSEREAVISLTAAPDQKRALISRLMQRRAISISLGVATATVVISRTLGGKPFEAGGDTSVERRVERKAPNFNFSVAHDGGLVVLASDPVMLVGVDVTAPFSHRANLLPSAEDGQGSWGGYAQLREAFENALTPDEWDAVEAEPVFRRSWGDGAQEEPPAEAADAAAVAAIEAPVGDAREEPRTFAFRRQWSRKESFVKARGDGLAFELRRVELCSCRPPQPPPADATPADSTALVGVAPHRPGQSGATEAMGASLSTGGALGRLVAADGASWSRVYVDEELRHDWACWTHELLGGHLVSVTRGPVTDAQDATGELRSHFRRPNVPAEEMAARLATPPPPFAMLRPRDLLPEERQSEFDASADPAGDEWAGPVRGASERGDGSVRAEGGVGKDVATLAGEPPAWMHRANIRSADPLVEGCSVS